MMYLIRYLARQGAHQCRRTRPSSKNGPFENRCPGSGVRETNNIITLETTAFPDTAESLIFSIQIGYSVSGILVVSGICFLYCVFSYILRFVVFDGTPVLKPPKTSKKVLAPASHFGYLRCLNCVFLHFIHFRSCMARPLRATIPNVSHLSVILGFCLFVIHHISYIIHHISYIIYHISYTVF